MASKYIFLSLPLDAFDSSDKGEAQSTLKSILSDSGSVLPYNIPSFKIGTLDALVQHADDLAKMEATCAGVVSKVADSLKTLLNGDEDKIAQHKRVNELSTDQYVSSFSWNKVIYRPDKPLAELVGMLQKEMVSVDNDVKSKLNQYNAAKTNLAALERQRTGNLSTKSLSAVVDPAGLIHGSEYLESHLIAVPKISRKDFLQTYETLTQLVVPRSAAEVAQDDEFVLFSVVTFRKTSAEFLTKCREQKWIPRQFKSTEGGQQDEQRQLDRAVQEEKKAWTEATRMAVTGWSGCVQAWLHIVTLRVFVEAVLRYGLPTTSKASKKVKTTLDTNYSYLGGNAVSRDKRGKVADDTALAAEMAAAGLGSSGGEYAAYVYYEVDIP
ncbi:probable H+-ATPase V1 subunit c, vacuolar [Cephalotrichum gorgonifer]|uniref:V-type proton ATPase subunit C n=1 Tax=Cephalotrichum gorgonifer TaxID=2041049 RepID=A0AAE8N2G2_9PEZI|nr:probable H+-ATPase V1 subunit c, vacuolar [Cephalotrichum gorgonifer]